MNDALPEWFFGSQKQFENYHDAIHNNYSGIRTGRLRTETYGFELAGSL